MKVTFFANILWLLFWLGLGFWNFCWRWFEKKILLRHKQNIFVKKKQFLQSCHFLLSLLFCTNDKILFQFFLKKIQKQYHSLLFYFQYLWRYPLWFLAPERLVKTVFKCFKWGQIYQVLLPDSSGVPNCKHLLLPFV